MYRTQSVSNALPSAASRRDVLTKKTSEHQVPLIWPAECAAARGAPLSNQQSDRCSKGNDLCWPVLQGDLKKSSNLEEILLLINFRRRHLLQLQAEAGPQRRRLLNLVNQAFTPSSTCMNYPLQTLELLMHNCVACALLTMLHLHARQQRIL